VEAKNLTGVGAQDTVHPQLAPAALTTWNPASCEQSELDAVVTFADMNFGVPPTRKLPYSHIVLAQGE